MPARKVDIVFCLDTSDSMKPCIDSVRENIGKLLEQLEKASFEWRLDFVAHNIPGRENGALVFHLDSVNIPAWPALYGKDANRGEEFFTKDVAKFKRRLGELECTGDESMLLALDTALDFPFGPADETQRVVILVSDEPFESNEPEAFAEAKTKVEALKQKIMDRHVTLLAVMPVREGGVAEELSTVDRADFTPVDEKDLGMKHVDMASLLKQLGKTISVTTVQSGGRDEYKRALFKQDKWATADSWSSIGDIK